jgi:myo-inositol-1(or 4)-monophosphatase
VAEVTALLELAKSAAVRAGTRLLENFAATDRSYVHSAQLPREVKAVADSVMERDILHGLAAAEIPVLSEESGYIGAAQPGALWFIVDPLDGTFNFVKRLGPSAVSIALWQGQTPIFGVIFDLTAQQLAWGGAGLGAYIDGHAIAVSNTSSVALASICTGFPVRFAVDDERAMQAFFRLISPYAKVRMLGSAAISLLHVARGSADVYLEQNIMLWDVAAGVAIVQGAGGVVLTARSDRDWCYEVIASNAALLPNIPGRERLRA